MTLSQEQYVQIATVEQAVMEQSKATPVNHDGVRGMISVAVVMAAQLKMTDEDLVKLVKSERANYVEFIALRAKVRANRAGKKK